VVGIAARGLSKIQVKTSVFTVGRTALFTAPRLYCRILTQARAATALNAALIRRSSAFVYSNLVGGRVILDANQQMPKSAHSHPIITVRAEGWMLTCANRSHSQLVATVPFLVGYCDWAAGTYSSYLYNAIEIRIVRRERDRGSHLAPSLVVYEEVRFNCPSCRF
jgi:hypothetical protein